MTYELGRALLLTDAVDSAALGEALLVAARRRVPLVRALADVASTARAEDAAFQGDALVQLELANAAADHETAPVASLELLGKLPAGLCARLAIAPLREVNGVIQAAAADVRDRHAAEELAYWLQQDVQLIRAPLAAIERALATAVDAATRPKKAAPPHVEVAPILAPIAPPASASGASGASAPSVPSAPAPHVSAPPLEPAPILAIAGAPVSAAPNTIPEAPPVPTYIAPARPSFDAPPPVGNVTAVWAAMPAPVVAAAAPMGAPRLAPTTEPDPFGARAREEDVPTVAVMTAALPLDPDGPEAHLARLEAPAFVRSEPPARVPSPPPPTSTPAPVVEAKAVSAPPQPAAAAAASYPRRPEPPTVQAETRSRSETPPWGTAVRRSSLRPPAPGQTPSERPIKSDLPPSASMPAASYRPPAPYASFGPPGTFSPAPRFSSRPPQTPPLPATAVRSPFSRPPPAITAEQHRDASTPLVPITMDDALAAVTNAADRDQLVDALLHAARSIARRVAIFAVRRDVFAGWTCSPELGDITKLRELALPLGAPSVLALATVAGSYFGPVSRNDAHAALLTVMTTATRDVAVVAVRASGRAALIVLADELTDTMTGTRHLEKLATIAGTSLGRLVRLGAT